MRLLDATPVYRFGWTLLHGIYHSLHRWEVYGRENIPNTGPFLLACNHVSFLDPPLFGAASPRALHYFARNTLFVGALGKLIRAYNAIPLDRDGGNDIAAFRQVFSILKNDGGLLVFPEGTRSPDGKLQEAKAGIGMIAARAGVPVIPARVFGTYEMLSRHMKRPDLLRPATVVIGPAIHVPDIDPGKGDPERFLKISRSILGGIGELQLPPQTEV